MTDRFRLTKPAIQDIEEIADYIAQQSGLEQSEKFLSKLESKFSKIVTFPYADRAARSSLDRLTTDCIKSQWVSDRSFYPGIVGFRFAPTY